MGYADPISTNPAMVLGGLEIGVTPLGWTYAYSTLGNDGDRVSGTLAPRPGDSPVSYTQVTDQDDHTIKGGDNDSTHEQVIDEGVAQEAKRILETVVSSGTGTNAEIGAEGQWGKTGTTENNGDAWFCGGVSDEVTACVWVGYPDSTTPMTTLFNGGPVMGGTFPALIWASVISAWEEIQAEPAAEKKAEEEGRETSDGDSGESRTPTYRRCRNGNRSGKRRKRTGAGGRSRTRRRSDARSGAGSRTRSSSRIQRGRRRGHRRLIRPTGLDSARPRVAAGRRRRLPAAQKRQGRSTALVIPIRGPVTTAAGGPSGPSSRNGSRPRSAPLRSRPMPSASVSLPGPRAELALGTLAAASPHLLDAGGRLQRPDQHRRRLALRFGDGVEQAVDAVGEVDVGAPRRPEEDLGAIGEADVGVAGGVVALVALGLDDRRRRRLRRRAGSRPGRGRRRGPSGRRTNAPAGGRQASAMWTLQARRPSRALFERPGP